MVVVVAANGRMLFLAKLEVWIYRVVVRVGRALCPSRGQ
jgi:hypothetical protein